MKEIVIASHNDGKVEEIRVQVALKDYYYNSFTIRSILIS